VLLFIWGWIHLILQRVRTGGISGGNLHIWFRLQEFRRISEEVFLRITVEIEKPQKKWAEAPVSVPLLFVCHLSAWFLQLRGILFDGQQWSSVSAPKYLRWIMGILQGKWIITLPLPPSAFPLPFIITPANFHPCVISLSVLLLLFNSFTSPVLLTFWAFFSTYHCPFTKTFVLSFYFHFLYVLNQLSHFKDVSVLKPNTTFCPEQTDYELSGCMSSCPGLVFIIFSWPLTFLSVFRAAAMCDLNACVLSESYMTFPVSICTVLQL